MIQFILNNKEIKTTLSPGLTLLDFIRYEQSLTGTKIGCREGDCGACTVLTGDLINGKMKYSSATSCLMPLGNARGKHIVTIEGINIQGLNMVQEAFVKEAASQCGFCTPGFIVSLTGFCLDGNKSTCENAIEAVSGNICRCTGYKSIERAIVAIQDQIQHRDGINAVDFAIANRIIPEYFTGIPKRLAEIPADKVLRKTGDKILGGGTDLYVQQHETIVHEEAAYLLDDPLLRGITREGNICEIGASTVVTEIDESLLFQQHFPGLKKMIRLVSSVPIRNMATIAGNFTNASPIGDLTIFFLALDAELLLSDGKNKRSLPLKDFYLGYKQLNKNNEEIIEKIRFELPGPSSRFNFEKVCKRTWLDIATVNTAISLQMNEYIITKAGLSAGGVGPVPAFLKKSAAFLQGKTVSAEMLRELLPVVQSEVSPISDVRGTETYKRLLLGQLVKAHFIELFPELSLQKQLG